MIAKFKAEKERAELGEGSQESEGGEEVAAAEYEEVEEESDSDTAKDDEADKYKGVNRNALCPAQHILFPEFLQQ